MTQKPTLGFPVLNLESEPEDGDEVTRPMGLHELPHQARIDRQMQVISAHHERIGKAITVFWGHKDCVEYLQKLILSGGDGFGNSRIGFRNDVMNALINLADLHAEKFGI